VNTYRLHIILLLFCFIGLFSFGQNNDINKGLNEALFSIRGSVYEKDTHTPYKDVQVLVNGGRYTATNFDGTFTVMAKIGDELIISHDDFETIYYTILKNERISIEVQDENQSGRRSKKYGDSKRFNKMIDSADVYLKTDAEKSIKFIGNALNVDVTSNQSAKAHELLGDVYMHWKHYDLAISAYKISIQNVETSSAKLKLANAYLRNDDYNTSISAYNSLSKKELSNYEKTLLYEGVGDAYLKTKNYSEAFKSYEDGLQIAKQHFIAPKVTDLNSKIAQAYNEQGEKSKANIYFSNSLDLAKKENKKRSIEEKVKVAEFNSDNQDYESEIELRKEIINDIKDIERDSVISNESAITSQKQNYKIGTALISQNRNDDAIPYFEKSRLEAGKKGDLVVGKDATRKLSEALIKKGDTEEGLAMIESYENIVDALYIQKEQELSQVARFSRNIAEQQNRITSLESDRELSKSKYDLTQEQNKSQKLIIYSLIGGLLLLLVTAYFMFKYIKQQKLANKLLALKSL
jgi:tetratricopeptide (TPR) repeat protein